MLWGCGEEERHVIELVWGVSLSFTPCMVISKLDGSSLDLSLSIRYPRCQRLVPQMIRYDQLAENATGRVHVITKCYALW